MMPNEMSNLIGDVSFSMAREYEQAVADEREMHVGLPDDTDAHWAPGMDYFVLVSPSSATELVIPFGDSVDATILRIAETAARQYLSS